jgi:hypothetical protein
MTGYGLTKRRYSLESEVALRCHEWPARSHEANDLVLYNLINPRTNHALNLLDAKYRNMQSYYLELLRVEKYYHTARNYRKHIMRARIQKYYTLSELTPMP